MIFAARSNGSACLRPRDLKTAMRRCWALNTTVAALALMIAGSTPSFAYEVTATSLGPSEQGEAQRIAVRWNGPLPQPLTVRYDANDDGLFSDHEALAVDELIMEPLEVVTVRIPPDTGCGRLQITVGSPDLPEDPSKVTVITLGSCSWSGSFFDPTGFDGWILALEVFDDGSGPALYAGGTFTVAGEVPASRVARWQGDEWQAMGAGFSGHVNALSVYDDGNGATLYAGGGFLYSDAIYVNHIARWTGTSWEAVGDGVNSDVDAFAVYDHGTGPELVATGSFTAAGGSPAAYIASWDGTDWAALGSGLDDQAYSLKVYDDGGGDDLYVGGFFTTAGGTTVNSVGRWDGSTWSSVGGGVQASGTTSVHTLEIYNDGGGDKLYAGGWFTTAGTGPAENFAVWDGTSWAEVGGGVGTIVYSMAVLESTTGDTLYVGNNSNVAAWNGTSWQQLGLGVNGRVAALHAYDDGSGLAMYVGGLFDTIDGNRLSSSIARWDEIRWSALGNGLNDSVLALTVFDDGFGARLYAGGGFTLAGGRTAQKIASWDGTTWEPVGNGFDAAVQALEVYDDGTGPALYAGGAFNASGGTPISGVARWNGASWVDVGGGIDQTVRALKVFDDGTGKALYAAGGFLLAGGTPARDVARWDGTTWTPLGDGLGVLNIFDLQALEVYDGGSGPELFTCGGMNSSENLVAKWDGAVWSAVGAGVVDSAGMGRVWALRVFDDGSGQALWAAGRFDTAGGQPVNRVARWDGTVWSGMGYTGSIPTALGTYASDFGPALFVGASDIPTWDGNTWAEAGPGASPAVFATYADGQGTALYAGGAILAVDGKPSRGIARYLCPLIFSDGFEDDSTNAWSGAVGNQ